MLFVNDHRAMAQQLFYLILSMFVASLEIQKMGVGILFSQEGESRSLSCNGTGERS
jgi:hypothetical protein